METSVNTLVHPKQPWLEAIRRARASAAPDAARPYFRCHPMAATISVGQCRANRARVPETEAQALPYALPSWQIRPPACEGCALAPAVEAGRVPFFSAVEVLAGQARESPSPPGGPRPN